MTKVRGRFAPSPTGGLHLGSALALLAAWLSVRKQGGSFVWRVEDLDGPRTVAGAAEQQQRDALWLGIDWDEGPALSAPTGTGSNGPHAPYHQSARSDLYEKALAHLAKKQRLFPCRHSRKDLLELATAPHGLGGVTALPGCAPTTHPRT